MKIQDLWPRSSWMVSLGLSILATVRPPNASALPSYARQTALSCTACHYTPPELNAAGRKFKLLGYTDRATGSPAIEADSSKASPGLNLLSSLPFSAWLETSFTATKSKLPGTQNGSFEFPQDVSLFLSGGWTTHLGSFLQVTYDAQNDHFSIDNTDVRFAKKAAVGGKDVVYGLTLNNNPTLEDLWNSTPAWGFPWIASDFAPTPAAAPIVQGTLAKHVAGLGGYAMWNEHLYLAATVYRTDHVGTPQPNDGKSSPYNIRGVAPYWRVAWQQSTATTQFEIGTYGIHLRSTPGGVDGPEDTYTDWAFDVQYDRTLFRKDVLSLRGTYIHQNSDLAGTLAAGGAQVSKQSLHSAMANAEYHFGSHFSATVGWFDTGGTVDSLLYAQSAVSGSATGDPRSTGYVGSLSFWPTQNWQLGFQYTGYTRFNGAANNYDGAGRNASDNNTAYLVSRFVF